jgi:ribosomal protein S18 acetylase RimI-like enzyme
MYITTDHEEDVHSASAQMVLTRNGRGVFLRPARPADAADLVMIQLQVLEDDISVVGDEIDTVEERVELINSLRPGDLYLVAEHRKRVVGALLLRRQPRSYLQHHAILGVELHRDFRGYGVGTVLIQQALAWGRKHGLEMIRLGVLDSNVRAKALYERLGFQATGYIPNFVKHPDGRYIGETQMVLSLTCHSQAA